MMKYRNDIDGLRAFAVTAVIVFHLGFMPNGYLGVDVFLVISGFLITSIVYKQLKENTFSLYTFYEKRVRRIIPLLLFITSSALIIGFLLMLPNDLENLAQSVVASNFSANNILMLITSKDYWATQNEYKPLMHTWSLGIEEQYYLIYPFVLLLIAKIRVNLISYFLVVATVISVVLFLFFGDASSRFYLLHYRFFELSIGGLFAIMFFNVEYRSDSKWVKTLFYGSILGLTTVFVSPYVNNQIQVLLTTVFTTIILTSGKYLYQDDKVSKLLFQNKTVLFLGKISFSLYLWHQLLFAFARYAYFDDLGANQSIFLVILTFLLSIGTYWFIENPFRNKQRLSTKAVFGILGTVFLITTVTALYVYQIGGVYKDFPVLGLTVRDVEEQGYNKFSGTDNVHIHYNEVVRELDKDFQDTTKFNVLVIGNSYGRDVANIFLESEVKSEIELSYFDIRRTASDSSIVDRWKRADLVVFSAKNFLSKESVLEIGRIFNFVIEVDKVFCFGTKDFGYSNGIHYNRMSRIPVLSNYYSEMSVGFKEIEDELTDEWKDKYISLIVPVSNVKGEVRIFTNEGKFISQDTVHLTKAGAIFYASLLKNKLKALLRL